MCLQFNGTRKFAESVTEFMERALAAEEEREGFIVSRSRSTHKK
jgi:hypothetical protein